MTILALALISSLALGLQAASTPEATMPEGSYILGPSDRIVVRCPGAEDFPEQPIRIDTDGHIMLPFIGRFQLAGLSVSEAEEQVSRQLARFIQHPDVQLSIVEIHSRPVSVLGAVKNPGSYQLEGRETMAEMLATAGGLRPDAGRTLTLTRSKEWGAIPNVISDQRSVDHSTIAELNIDDTVQGRSPLSNMELRPHDVISVSQAAVVYVVGQVRRPGGFPFVGGSECSVLQALALAEGLDTTAAPKRALILRKQVGSGRIEIPVNVERILGGRAPDTPLQAEDVLFIPNNAAKSIGMKTLDTILQTATGMAIYGRF
jgi:polysaccharide export outer membrane protein